MAARPNQLVIENRTPIGARVVIAAIGTVPLIFPGWKLQPWTIDFGLFAVGIWVIVLGAAGLGLAFIAVALFSSDEILRVEHGLIHLHRSSIFGTIRRRYTPDQVRAITLKISDWSDGPDTYSVRVEFTKDRRSFISQTFHKKADAEALQTQISNAFGH
jgi:uncharacterized membrane protein